MKDVRLSLRLLFESDRLRIFYTTIRLDPYHPGDVEAWREVVGAMGDRDILIWGMYWFSDEAYFREAAVWYDSVPFPRDRVWVLGNTEAEVAAARRAGFPALWVNNNAWLDESLFKPQPVEKQHRAILISQDVPYKRIHLAAEVDDLVLVLSQRFPSAPLVDRSRLSTAHVVGKLSSSEVVAEIFRRGNVDACAQEVFARVYRHKMVDYVDVPTALALVGG